ncbi:ATP-dependent DNA helicase RecG [Sphingobacterium sp. lm-10]|uniref:ATP-dependent DNA helicase RecG n=1 Tax=Sphingobacterium sp. lm-10 TaxID=2944904 RepID=UPI002021C1BF|nr:ATP-dependent DNA helicase RecG [Sphingobacterium sp. lm-10]MCL7988511.1 ATP-dependent DNA helicase RecG [Sphingobacterium sp. lm-10]
MAVLTAITPIEYLKGVGPQKADVLKKELQIFTIGDLLQLYPFRYVDRTQFYKIRELDATLLGAQVLGRLIRLQEVGEKRSKRLVGLLKDETGTVELVWFQQLAWLKKTLQLNAVYVMYGKPSSFNGALSITHPEMELYQASEKKIGNQTLQPVYTSTEKLKKFNLDTKGLQKLVAQALETVLPNWEDDLPEALRVKHRLIPSRDALLGIHFPPDQATYEAATRRLKFDELFWLQLRLLRNKQLNTKRYRGHRFTQVGDHFNTFFNSRLPFPLTNAQKRVMKEIRIDTNTGAQMNRLVQGDVGSGKTVVALMAMLLAIDNGFQACMMAPTEILATQHYHGVKELLGEELCEVALLTGSTPAKERRRIHEQLEDGSLHILIGTHALIEDKVRFKNIGFVVIDEQHRFGVEQRAKLWRKNSIPPHMLVMTATPIPRTLAMTMYGDLDISAIDELPAGRKPIKTVHFFEGQRLRAFGFMREEIQKGRQIYIVYPLIKESEKLDLLHLEAGLEYLMREFPLPTYRISVVHGKMPVKDKNFEMQRFVKGETQIMVATTVIEVGVNVPNASVMIIENAERFGLSQLHQLRGRVGRGAEQSFCILMSGNKLSKDGRKRLETMVETNDGFKIAEVDLQLRGPGDISGTQQSGILEMKIANLSTDQALLTEVRETVMDIFLQDPELQLPQHQLLLQKLAYKGPAIAWDKIS